MCTRATPTHGAFRILTPSNASCASLQDVDSLRGPDLWACAVNALNGGGAHQQMTPPCTPSKGACVDQWPGTPVKVVISIPENDAMFAPTPTMAKRRRSSSLCRRAEERRVNERLWDAIEAGDVEAVSEAVKLADTNARALHRWTPLHVVASMFNEAAPAIIEVLVEHGAELEALTESSYTPLAVACEVGNITTMETLLRLNANPATSAEGGKTCCHLAVEKGRTKVVEYLLAHFPECASTRNNVGQTPPQMAQTVEMRQLFKTEVADNYSRTLFADTIRYNSRRDVVSRMLLRPPRTKSEPSDPVVAKHRGRRNSKPFVTLRTLLEDDEVDENSFQFIAILGKGAFGEVYQVVHRGTQQVYAMKILKKSTVFGRNLVRYAMTERNVLSSSRHPFIVPLHFAFQTTKHLALVLEFCPGGNLAQLIARHRKLKEPLARLYAAEILLALEHLHEQNILYRDLKPANVVLDIKGHAMLTDFGLSKEGVSGQGAQSFCGSVAYLAPEMLRRRGHGHTVDIYGLGVILYEMLTGHPPYWAQEKEQIFRNIERASLEIPSTYQGSPEAVSLIEELMEKAPTKRLGSVKTSDVRGHPFFNGVDWSEVLQKDFIPLPRVHKRLTHLQESRQECLNPLSLDPEHLSRKSPSQRTVHGWDFFRRPSPNKKK